MGDKFKEGIRQEMFKNVSTFSAKDPDASAYQGDAYKDAINMSSEIGENKKLNKGV